VKKYMAHDEHGQAKIGDSVRIAEAAPTSKRKRWQLVEVLTRIELPEIAPEAIDSTLVQELAAPVAPPPPPAGEEAPEIEVVQADAGPEALETQEQTATAEMVAHQEPEVPPMEEEEPVQMDAAPEATEEGA
jgi:hypothetical protein